MLLLSIEPGVIEEGVVQRCAQLVSERIGDARRAIDLLRGSGEVAIDRRVGRTQTVETLINEETLLLAKYLRDERKTWIPRIASLIDR